MTERQGEVYRIEQALTRRISNVICQSFKNKFSDEEFTKKLTDKVLNEFQEPLFEKSSEAFLKAFDPNKYKDAIKNSIFDKVQDNKSKILSMYSFVNAPKKNEGRPLRKRSITRRRSPIPEINPHPPLLTFASPPSSK